MGPTSAHDAPTTRSLRAHSVQEPYWEWTGGPEMGPPGQMMRLLCAHYGPTLSQNRFGVPPMGSKCAPDAPTTRPLRARSVHEPFRGRAGGPDVRPRRAYYAATPVWCWTDGPEVHPRCACYAPTTGPLCPRTVLALGRWAGRGPTMRPLGAHSVQEAFCCWTGVPDMGRTRRPLGAHYVQEPFWWARSVPMMRLLRAHYGPTLFMNRFGCRAGGPDVRPRCAY